MRVNHFAKARYYVIVRLKDVFHRAHKITFELLLGYVCISICIGFLPVLLSMVIDCRAEMT